MFLSILGMYEYDNSVFNGFQVPDGIDRDILINNILLNCAELEVVYPDIDTMKLAISTWSLTNLYTWDKLYKTTQLVYNPIWNVDADITEKHDRGVTESGESLNIETRAFIDEETRDLTDKKTLNTTDTETPNLTDTHSVQGYNSTVWAGASKDEKTGTDTITHTGTDTDTHTGTDTIEHTGSGSYESSNDRSVADNTDISIRRTGNIGVTTTQQMIREEREVAEFSIIEYITQSFKERFCLLIY